MSGLPRDSFRPLSDGQQSPEWVEPAEALSWGEGPRSGWTQHRAGSQTTAQLLAVGKYDIGFADSAPVMKLIADGAEIRVLATILQGNPNAVTALKKTGLKSVKDIKGHSVAMPTAGSEMSMFRLVHGGSSRQVDFLPATLSRSLTI